MSIADNIKFVRSRIAAAAVKAGRDPLLIRLVAVSKTKPAVALNEAIHAGQRLFGENYVQELITKAPQVIGDVEWHYIGGLQSNKVRQVAGLVTMIHSVGRLSLACEINRQWGQLGLVCDVLIQVNIACEPTKRGVTNSEVLDLVRKVAELSHLRVRGLMTMPPFFDDPELARPYFRGLKRLAEKIAAEGIPNVAMDELSMGMSGDFDIAIEEGATLVRIGSLIFGDRVYA